MRRCLRVLFQIKIIIPMFCAIILFSARGHAEQYSKDEACSKVEDFEKKELANEHLNILGFWIGRHSLDDVQSKLGYTSVFRKSNEEEAPLQICYRSMQEKRKIALIFESGPLGAWHMITGFRILSGEVNFSDKCKPSSLISENVSTESGLKIGITKEQFLKILGKPTKEKNNVLSYCYYMIKEMTETEIERVQPQRPNVKDYPFYEVTSGVEASFKDSKLVSLEVSKLTGY